ncbi:hypothetical protein KXR53_22770 [Inquilinus limosus]|uniref:hypothetical protein n=1 Tax=Inquilinus limosus TaxID=171674 RepID=UPI003F18C958
MVEPLADATGGWALAPILLWLFREGRFLADPNELTRPLALPMPFADDRMASLVLEAAAARHLARMQGRT